MSNSLFEHDFQKDLKPNQNTYCTQDIQWKYINDNNQGNYSNGYIKKKRDDPTTSPSIAYRIRSLLFCLWYHIVVSRRN